MESFHKKNCNLNFAFLPESQYSTYTLFASSLLQIKPHEEKFLEENHAPAREEKNMFWNECFEAIMVGSHKRNREVGESKLKFLVNKIILIFSSHYFLFFSM